ncbi:MAG: acylphosphatase [Cyanobium sp.]
MSRAAGRCGLRLLCRGRVQGVGFRPLVSRLAASLGLDGTLTNVCGAVRLELAGSRQALERFHRCLPTLLQPPARLESIEVCWLEGPLSLQLASGRGVQILASPPSPLGEGWLAPALVADLAPCADCLAELQDPASRRYRYPFLSCSRCGPRYSIATAEPWCRAHTTLAPFRLCPACRAEFEDPADRRFHAETIACPACGPRLQLDWLASVEKEHGGRPAVLDPDHATGGGPNRSDCSRRNSSFRHSSVRHSSVRPVRRRVGIGPIRSSGLPSCCAPAASWRCRGWAAFSCWWRPPMPPPWRGCAGASAAAANRSPCWWPSWAGWRAWCS